MDAFDRARDLGEDVWGTAAQRSSKLLREFKAFVLRGNVVDLAVGVVIGAAFGAIVNSLVKDVLTPLLGLAHVPDFAAAAINVGKHAVKDSHGHIVHLANGDSKYAFDAQIRYGVFVNAIISFLLISATVFFFVVKPLNKLMALRKTEPDTATLKRDCPECLSKIPTQARRCAFCTAEIGAAA